MKSLMESEYLMHLWPILAFGTFVFVSADITRKNKNTKRVHELWVYPIKSCRGISVNRWPISRRGLRYDRNFMVVDANNKFVSQRSQPRMALITTRIDEISSRLIIQYNDKLLTVPLVVTDNDGPQLTVTIWGDACEAIEIPDAGKWFSQVLEVEGLKFVCMKESFVRGTDPDYAPEGQTGFSDGYPFLLASTASLDDLNSRLKTPVSMTNFRPNIIVSGCTPFEEDRWRDFVVKTSKEDISMSVVKPCSRCKMPNVDPNTGIMSSENQPAATMKTFRTGGDIGLKKDSWRKELFFGQNVDHKGRDTGFISVGDKLSILSFNNFQ